MKIYILTAFGTVIINIVSVMAFTMPRVNNSPTLTYSEIQLYFPSPTGQEKSALEMSRIQRAIKSKANNKEQSVISRPSIPTIYFNEDDIEPLAPEPKFKIRIERPPPTPEVVIVVPRWPPMVSDEEESQSQPEMTTNSTKMKVTFPKTGSIEMNLGTKTSNSTQKPMDEALVFITTTPAPPKSVVIIEEQDIAKSGDEIMIDSLYVPFKIQNTESRRRRQDNNNNNNMYEPIDFKYE